MKKKEKRTNGQTGGSSPLPIPTEQDGALSLRHFFFAGNAPLLELVISLPLPTGEGKGAKKIAAFYRRLAEESVKGAEAALLPALQRAYEADTDPRKRFRHRPARLTVRGRVTEESEKYFSAVWESRLVCGAQKETVRRGAEIFTVKNGRLCPPAYLLYKGVPKAAPQEGEGSAPQSHIPPKKQKSPPQSREERRKKTYFLENGVLHPLDDKIRIF